MADLDLAILEAEMPALYFHRAQALRFSNRRAAIASLRKAYELKLTRAGLHPLEQQAYNELVAALEEK
jgi:glycine betaine/choline ABC-type transport system substrate-binding protein